MLPLIISIISMFLILVVAAGVVIYVAFPHRDQVVPGAPWLGDAMKRGVDAMPTLDDPPGDVEGLGLNEFTRR